VDEGVHLQLVDGAEPLPARLASLESLFIITSEKYDLSHTIK